MLGEQNFKRIAGLALASSLLAGFASSPVFAQDADNDCVCVVRGGTVGAVTSATGWVKLNGDVGLIDATTNAPLSLGSVLRTGVSGSASATIGAGCNVNLAALSELSISALDDGRMCVRLIEQEPVASSVPVAAVAGGLLLGGAIVVGLGQDDPVSQ